VKRAEELDVELQALPLSELQAIEPRITEAVFGVLSPEASARSRSSYGGTAPDQVRRQVKLWKERLA
jgi:argininosuccinate lyase